MTAAVPAAWTVHSVYVHPQASGPWGLTVVHPVNGLTAEPGATVVPNADELPERGGQAFVLTITRKCGIRDRPGLGRLQGQVS
jgi:hypothetical protein